MARPIVVLDSVTLDGGSQALSLELMPGDSYGLMGPGGSGKSLLLGILGGSERPASGMVSRSGETRWAGIQPNRRSTPVSLARAVSPKDSAGQVEVLSALGLWDFRDTLTSRLSPGQLAACDLLPCFLGKGNLICIDDTLDLLDPWTLQGAWGLLSDFLAKGGAVLATTNQSSLAGRLGSLIVVKDLRVKFAGSVRDLLAETRPVEMTVETKDPAQIQALAEPFTFTIRQEGGTMHMHAADGQALSAKLLVEGYGAVRSIVLREPTLDEALMELV